MRANVAVVGMNGLYGWDDRIEFAHAGPCGLCLYLYLCVRGTQPGTVAGWRTIRHDGCIKGQRLGIDVECPTSPFPTHRRPTHPGQSQK
jgi:hypothetical protein